MFVANLAAATHPHVDIDLRASLHTSLGQRAPCREHCTLEDDLHKRHLSLLAMDPLLAGLRQGSERGSSGNRHLFFSLAALRTSTPREQPFTPTLAFNPMSIIFVSGSVSTLASSVPSVLRTTIFMA